MQEQRYNIVGKNGKTTVVKKAGSRYIGIDELAQHVAMDILDDYQSITNGDKKIEETNIELSIKVLTAIAPVIEAFRSASGYGMDSTFPAQRRRCE
nr:MAG TPA: hypothetical protein [Caudoviricetes sp.]